MARKKRYDDGGLTFAEMKDEDRAGAAKAAMEAINARQAKASEEAGGASTVKSTPRAAAKPVAKGDIGENLRDMDMAGVDTGYSDTEAKRNLARAGSRHARGDDYSDTEAKRNLARAGSRHAEGPKERTIPQPKKSAVRDLYDTFKSAPRLMKSGGIASASKRADGCAVRGKTKGRMV